MKKVWILILLLPLLCGFGGRGISGSGTGAGAETGAYDASDWNGNTYAPTKDAVRDKIEAMPSYTEPAGLHIIRRTSAGNVGASGITEDGTDINAGALNFITTGTIQGGIKISSDADGMDAAAMTAAGMYGTLFIATGAGTWILPRAVLGMSGCLMDSGTAHDLILDVTAGSTIRLKGTEGSDGVGITNASGSTTGDFVCFVAVATDKWSTVGMSGTWASQ